MTAELKSIIEQIGAKAQQLHQALVAERARVSSLTEEMNRLNAALSASLSEKEQLEKDLQQANAALNNLREQAQISSTSTAGNVEIDVLVKEIDFCIQQLKIANE